MKVLIVCSRNSGKIAPYIQEQGKALANSGITVDFFAIKGKGFLGYLKNRKGLLDSIQRYMPDIIHAHYGLSGLLANTQLKVPVITTYHGSDINVRTIYLLSRLNMILSAHNIFVSEKNRQKSDLARNQSLIPCGVDINLFQQINKVEARQQLSLNADKKYILFAGAFSNSVKNPNLAKSAVSFFQDTELIELNGYSRHEVALLLNAVDMLLLTSFSEGSPQIIKEAMACNCPIVSVPVGDVEDVISGIAGCYISSYQLPDIVTKIKQAFALGERTKGRNRIIEMGLDIDSITQKIQNVYNKILSESK